MEHSRCASAHRIPAVVVSNSEYLDDNDNDGENLSRALTGGTQSNYDVTRNLSGVGRLAHNGAAFGECFITFRLGLRFFRTLFLHEMLMFLRSQFSSLWK